ncbi:MAG: hypothetical protein KBS83_00845 [Lachnospiraceae bacterium]|nr:hypothetical protein [Candidatus Equihabitans merdae]
MAKITGVRFRHAGKMYYFNPNDLNIKYGDAVVVETARGLEYGKVMMATMDYPEDKLKAPLKDVLRLATEEDTAKDAENQRLEKEAFHICKEKIREHELDMKLIAVEYAFDDSKILFYFTADGRIDFRELVKDLASVFRRRIELRQIGVRDETKLLGGMGICGRPLCCHTYLNEFAPVSIKMAKEQNLSLNPTKISGSCGRLMCCLKNEADTYAELKKDLPVKGDQATIPDGRHGEVHSVNILRQLVKIVVETGDDDRELVEFPVSEITFIPHSKRPKPNQPKKKVENKPAEGEQPQVSAEQKKFRQAVKKALENQQAEQEERVAEEQRREEAEAAARENAGRERSRRNRHRNKNHEAAENASEQQDNQVRAEAPEKSERREKPERGNRGGRGDKSEHGERAPKADRSERSGRPERGDKADRAEKIERPEKAPKGDGVEKADHAEGGDHAEKSGDAARRRRRRHRPHKSGDHDANREGNQNHEVNHEA